MDDIKRILDDIAKVEIAIDKVEIAIANCDSELAKVDITEDNKVKKINNVHLFYTMLHY